MEKEAKWTEEKEAEIRAQIQAESQGIIDEAVSKADKITEDALAERLQNLREIDETKYRLVLANIMYAKSYLKSKGAYKASKSLRDSRENGSIGGVGIENLILQNGGSFIDASKDFLEHAEGKDFIDFEKEYAILDFGCNHVAKSKRSGFPYDNFIMNNMRCSGFENTIMALRSFLNTYEMKSENSTKVSL